MIAMPDDGYPRPDHTMTADEESRRRRPNDEACFCPPVSPSPGWRPPSNRRERRLAAALGLKLLPMSEP